MRSSLKNEYPGISLTQNALAESRYHLIKLDNNRTGLSTSGILNVLEIAGPCHAVERDNPCTMHSKTDLLRCFGAMAKSTI